MKVDYFVQNQKNHLQNCAIIQIRDTIAWTRAMVEVEVVTKG
jgi:hypothetical protein